MALSLLAANNAQTVLAAGISSTATSLTVNTGTGTLFPSPVTGTSFFKLTIIDAATGTLTEIVHVTARNGDVFTIQRGQEGTVPRAWSANDIVANMMTAGTLSYILGNFQPLDPTLTALAALVGVANKLPYFNGDDTAALTDLTQIGRDIIGKTDIAAVLQYLGLQFFKSSPSSVSSAFTSVFSPDENIRIVLANNRVWGVQDNDGNVIPLPLDRGGLGATSAEEGVKNLGLADSEGRVGRLINVRVITASGTYTPSAGTKSVVAEIQGGGGAGGGSLGSVPTQASAGTGGNAGAYILHRFTTPPSGITVTIGAGGMGVPGANGNPGGNTSFGSMTAPGGAGGIYYAPQTPPLFSFNNSSSVTPTGGNLVNKAGQRGDPATVTSPLYGGSGDGGASLLGGGGDGRGVVAVSSNGNTATGYGAGGGGATSGGGSGGNASGGNGAPGVVIVWECA